MENEKLDQVVSVISGLQKHQFKVNLLQVGVVFLFICLVFGFYVHGSNQQAAAMAKYEMLLADYKKDTKELQAKLNESYEIRIKEKEFQAQRQQSIQTRNTRAESTIASVTQPDRELSQVAEDIHEYLGMLPVVEPSQRLSFSKEMSQQLVSLKIDRDRLEGNLKDKTDQYDSALKQVASLEGDVKLITENKDKCEAALTQLDKVKKPSKFKAALKSTAVFMAGIALGKLFK